MASASEVPPVEDQGDQILRENQENVPPKDESVPSPPRPVSKTQKNSAIAAGGMEKGFYKHFMNPFFAKMEETVRKNNEILDEIQRKMDKEREEERKKKMSEHLPEVIKGKGQDLTDIMKHLEDLIVFENYKKEDNDDHSKLVKAHLKQLDENAEVAILSHSMAAYVSTLEPQHLRQLANKMVDDVTQWISSLFRFQEGEAFFHEDECEGLVRVCRLALHSKYPKYATDGYEALFTRPPVFYVSGAAKPLLGQYLCTQLGLPMSCLVTVPCSTKLGSVQKMDVRLLRELVEEDTGAGKLPVLIVAYAGTPVVGTTDNLEALRDLCKKGDIWLHMEGNNLPALTLFSVPTDIIYAKTSHSLTLNLSSWLGLPAVPCVTLYKSADRNLSSAAGLTTVNTHYKLNCMPLWTCLQNLGHDGISARIKYSLELSKKMHENIENVPSLQNVSKRQKAKPQATEQTTTHLAGLGGLVSKALASLSKRAKVPLGLEEETFTNYNALGAFVAKALDTFLIFEIENPTVVFRYNPSALQGAGDAEDVTPLVNGVAEAAEDAASGTRHEGGFVRDPYLDALNVWLCETLRRDVTKVYVTAVDLGELGVCIRFAPMESSQMFDTSSSDLKLFFASMDRQLSILDATVRQRADFQDIVIAQDNMRLITLPNWAGLGAVQYIPEMWVAQLDLLPDGAQLEINNLNSNLVHQLKSADLAFSLGRSEDGQNCVRFGLITEDTDLEELIALVYTTGKEVEESSKFLETMAEVVREGIEKANSDLVKESQEKIYQEGVLRQVPLVGSLLNWWSPPPKEAHVKGRSFNLASGKIESTETTYKYHLQVQESAAELTSRHHDGPLKVNLKPAKKRNHSEASSSGSLEANSLSSPAAAAAAIGNSTSPLLPQGGHSGQPMANDSSAQGSKVTHDAVDRNAIGELEAARS